MNTVYLAGPIAGCDKGEANDWRKTLIGVLADNGIAGVSPLRCEPLVGKTYALVYEDKQYGTASAINAKNKYDVRRCDLIFVHMPKAMIHDKPSYGTVMEIAWAIMLNKPIILVTDHEPLRNHPLISDNVPWIFSEDEMDDAVDTIFGLLEVYS